MITEFALTRARRDILDAPLDTTGNAVVRFTQEPTHAPLPPPPEPLQVSNLKKWARAYLHSTKGAVTASTERRYMTSLWTFICWIEDRPISGQVIDEFHEHRLQSGVTPVSCAKDVRIIGQLFQFAVKEKLVFYNPVHYSTVKKNVTAFRTRRLTLQQYETLKNGMPPGFFRSLLIVGYNTGLRRSDLIRLRWDHVDMKRGRIDIPLYKTRRYGKKSIIPIVPNSDLAIELANLKIKSASPYVLGEARGFRTESLSYKFQKNCRRVIPGIKVSIHDLRRSFITNVVSSGVDARVVCSVCGIGFRQLPHYWVPNEEAHRTAMEKLFTFMSPKEKVITNE